MPVTGRPAHADVIRALTTGAYSDSGADFDPTDSGRVWTVDGYPYDQDTALKLAEIAVITGQPLTAVATVNTLHSIVTRMAELEAAVAAFSGSATTRTMTRIQPLRAKAETREPMEKGTGE